MKCKITECSSHDDCAIIDITKKQPENADKCSYFKTFKQLEKKSQKHLEQITKKNK